MLDEYLMTVCTLLIGILLPLPALLGGRAAATCAEISADDRARWAVLDIAARHCCRSRLRSIPGHHVEVSALG